MAHTFRVDDVDLVRAPLDTVEMVGAVSDTLAVELNHVSHQARLIAEGRGVHPLLQAVHVAFAQHRPLSLSPDHVWLTLAHGFAIHVDQHAEELRRRFVRHDGRAEILVDVPDVPGTSEEWTAVITRFAESIEGHVGPRIHRLLSCAFSTTTERERVAADVVMMSAFRRYFVYTMRTICGIPEITLEGTPDDWTEIRSRLDVMAEYDLAWWAGPLRPVLDELVKTARGTVDRNFWQCIYKPMRAYREEAVTGWVMRLFPYLQPIDGPTSRNPAVLSAQENDWITRGIELHSAPTGLSRASMTLITESSRTRLSLFGGFAGVRQLESGALRPEICWAVGASPRMTALVDRIVTEHEARPPVEPTDDLRMHQTAALMELYERCDGAVLFGRWNLARAAELRMLVGSTTEGFLGMDPRDLREADPTRDGTIAVLPFCTLESDPRFFGLCRGDDDFVVVLCDPRKAENPEELLVVADDIPTFLERIFEHAGTSWFEDLRGPKLYNRLNRFHNYLRRALTVGPHEPPSDLDLREKQRIIVLLARRQGSQEQRAFWWEALRRATGTTKTFDQLFRNKVPPGEIMAELDLADALGRQM